MANATSTTGVESNGTRDNAEQLSIVQQLANAHSEIEQLKLQLAWTERSYE